LWPELCFGLLSYVFDFKICVSPHGTFTSYSLSTGNPFKKLYINSIVKLAFKNVKTYFVTTDSEYRDTLRFFPAKSIVIIPWGVKNELLNIFSAEKKKVILYLGRIHPHKGLDLLVKSWIELGEESVDWELHIVGSHIGLIDDLTEYYNSLKLLSLKAILRNIKFFPAIYSAKKYEKFSECMFSILMSNGENFGMSVLESLALGTPVIISPHVPWPNIERDNCGFISELEETNIKNVLSRVFNMNSEEYKDCTIACRNLVQDNYTWEKIVPFLQYSYGKLIDDH
jgi:glycosyltransferase involved in cell wall biosynthesis